MKLENKLYGAFKFKAWKTRIDLILAKNKVLDIVKGKIVEPEFQEGKEKELQNVNIPRDKEKSEQPVIVLRITRLPT
jgi:hypothetical protein